MKEHTCALTMLKQGASIAHIAGDLLVSKNAISDQNRMQQGFRTTPCQPGSGMKKKTTDGTNAVWHRDVMLNPSITTANMKKKRSMLL